MNISPQFHKVVCLQSNVYRPASASHLSSCECRKFVGDILGEIEVFLFFFFFFIDICSAHKMGLNSKYLQFYVRNKM